MIGRGICESDALQRVIGERTRRCCRFVGPICRGWKSLECVVIAEVVVMEAWVGSWMGIFWCGD